MINSAQFTDPDLAQRLVLNLKEKARSLSQVIKIMEVCGTHTMEIGRLGLRSILPAQIKLISGPGCPVCVTPGSYINLAVECAQAHKAIILTYGDMLRVPGDNNVSLEKARAQGVAVEVVTSSLQALEVAQQTNQEVIFLAVGFETTIPATAVAILKAREKKLKNLSFLVSHRLIPPALKVLVEDQELGINGFLLPGHVSTIIGESPYRFLEAYVPSVITGFEPLDILWGINKVLELIIEQKTELFNAYPRVVKPEGNPQAQKVIYQVSTVMDEEWRGIGVLPATGLKIKKEYQEFDAMVRFGLKSRPSQMPGQCLCGEVLKGKYSPFDCKLFGRACTPEHPVGPCMVSVEGSCAAYYKYERDKTTK